MKAWYIQNRAIDSQWTSSADLRAAVTAQAKLVGADPGEILDAPPGSVDDTKPVQPPARNKEATTPTSTETAPAPPQHNPTTTPPAAPAASPAGYGQFSATAVHGRPSADETLDFARRLEDHLRGKYGLTDEQIAGIFANLMIESRFKVNIRENGGQWGGDLSTTMGNGLAQWTGMQDVGANRAKLFKEYSEAKGLDPNSELANVMFLDHELEGPYKHVMDQIKNTNSAYDAMRIFGEQFEIPAQPNWDQRNGFIQGCLDFITGTSDAKFRVDVENV